MAVQPVRGGDVVNKGYIASHRRFPRLPISMPWNVEGLHLLKVGSHPFIAGVDLCLFNKL